MGGVEMVLNEEFKEFIMGQLEGLDGVSVRNMFGGAGIFHDGKMFALLHRSRMFLKVDDSNREGFESAGMEQFQPFENKPMKMPYYEVPPEVLEEKDLLQEWSKASIKVAHG
jgi:DNA transformation protein